MRSNKVSRHQGRCRHLSSASPILTQECRITPEQKKIVRRSFARIRPASQSFAALFYSCLFELSPGLRPLFKNDLEEQGRKLMQMIKLAIFGPDRPGEILPTVQELGRRHVGYGGEDRDYEFVGSAPLWALQRQLGAAFPSDVRDAWMAMYTVLAVSMKSA